MFAHRVLEIKNNIGAHIMHTTQKPPPFQQVYCALSSTIGKIHIATTTEYITTLHAKLCKMKINLSSQESFLINNKHIK